MHELVVADPEVSEQEGRYIAVEERDVFHDRTKYFSHRNSFE